MKRGILTLAKYRLSRAKDAYQDGIVLMGQDSFYGAMNRFYYAAFYAARALLATKGLDSSKHSGVIALFQQHFVSSGLINTEIAKALPRSFQKRLRGDYEDFVPITEAGVKEVKEQVERFVSACESCLRDVLESSHG